MPALVSEVLVVAPPPAAPRRAQISAQRARRGRAQVDRNAWPVVPVALTSAGVLFLSAGAAFGLAANATEREHANARTDSERDVDAALDTYETARTQALLANLGLGIGAAALAAGVTLWAIDAGDHERALHARLAPRIARGGAGLVLEGRFAEPMP